MPSTVESLPVFDDVIPDFSDPVQIIASNRTDAALISRAADAVAFPSKYPRHLLRHQYRIASGLAAADPLRKVCDFFAARAGRHGGFWLPSWVEELAPVGSASGTSLTIQQVEYDATYLQATAEVTRLGNYVWLYDYDGTIDFRKVTAASTGATETLTLSSSLSKTFAAGEFSVGFLYFVRFNTDELRLRFPQRGEVEIDLSFIEVFNVDSEADT